MTKKPKFFRAEFPLSDQVVPSLFAIDDDFEPSPPEASVLNASGRRFGYFTPDAQLRLGFPDISSDLAFELKNIFSLGLSDRLLQSKLEEVLEAHGFDRLLKVRRGLLDQVSIDPLVNDEEVRILRHLSNFGREIVVYGSRSGLCHTFAQKSRQSFDWKLMERSINKMEVAPLDDLSLRSHLAYLANAPLGESYEFEQYRQAMVRLREIYLEQIAQLSRGQYEYIGLLFELGKGEHFVAHRMQEAALARRPLRMVDTSSPRAYHVFVGPPQSASA